MTSSYSPQGRAERLLAVCRALIASFSLFAVWLDPNEPAKYAAFTYGLMVSYVGYAFLLLLLAWRSDIPLVRSRVFTHCIDLAIFSLLIYFTEGAPTNQFFLFSLVCGTVRWQWRGALWTAAVAFLLFIGAGIYSAEVLRDPTFDLNPFIIRGVHLVVVAVLLSYLGAYQSWLSDELFSLAAWPRATSPDARTLVSQLLEHAGNMLSAPHVLLIWEDPDEPWLNWVTRVQDSFTWNREPLLKSQSLVVEPLTAVNFLCPNTQIPMPTVLQTSTTEIHSWQGQPLHPDLQAQVSARAVLSFRLLGENLDGRVFFFDKFSMTSDDLVLGATVAREMTSRLDQFYLLQRLQRTAALEERIRLARDLHDGLLQSLTGAALQLETIQRVLDKDVRAARERLGDIQRILSTEQRELRFFIEELRPPGSSSNTLDTNLHSRLTDLVERITWQWRIPVDLQLESEVPPLPGLLTREIYHILREAVVNAARHGQARTIQVKFAVATDKIQMLIADDGRGFPFHGRYDLTELIERNIGPTTLKERISALNGDLMIDSTDTGSQLFITLPCLDIGKDEAYPTHSC
ncbi:MAG: sensor histidine kinase [Candidatus Binatia bacterium]